MANNREPYILMTNYQNLYKEKYNKNFLYIENGFGIHTIYNTIYGNQNIWNIGMEDGYTYEENFVDSIIEKLK